MNKELLITLEILITIVVPLIALYLRGRWPLRTIIPCLLIMPIVWYLTYSPLHELSHVFGTYLVGGKVTSVKLIPRFWAGEFGRAWITSEGIGEGWQRLIMTSFPYGLDLACVIVALAFLRRDLARNPFVIGLSFMLLCLRPAFDFVCETIAFASGDQGDIFHIEATVGGPVTWSLLTIVIGLSLFTIARVLQRFIHTPQMKWETAT